MGGSRSRPELWFHPAPWVRRWPPTTTPASGRSTRSVSWCSPSRCRRYRCRSGRNRTVAAARGLLPGLPRGGAARRLDQGHLPRVVRRLRPQRLHPQDLCVLIEKIQSSIPEADRRDWPPILALGNSVVITLTYLRRNRVPWEPEVEGARCGRAVEVVELDPPVAYTPTVTRPPRQVGRSGYRAEDPQPLLPRPHAIAQLPPGPERGDPGEGHAPLGRLRPQQQLGCSGSTGGTGPTPRAWTAGRPSRGRRADPTPARVYRRQRTEGNRSSAASDQPVMITAPPRSAGRTDEQRHAAGEVAVRG